MRALKAFADLVRTTSLACVHEKIGGFSDYNSSEVDQIRVRQNGTLTERDLRHEVVQLLNLSSATLACCVLFRMLSEQ